MIPKDLTVWDRHPGVKFSLKMVMAKVQAASMARNANKEMSKAELSKAAFVYLGRYASSVENLRRVLNRRVVRARIRHRRVPAVAGDWVDEVVAECAAKGFVNDADYAFMMVRSDLRQGRSRWQMQARLRQKGVGRDVIEGAIEKITEDFEDQEALEFAAARIFARRRRFGPFRKRVKGQDRDQHQQMLRRELAAFARAGFGYEIARRFVDAPRMAEGES